jgi:hypothetical protein
MRACFSTTTGLRGGQGVTRAAQAEALGIVFTALDADGIMVIEAPDGHRRRDGALALETFAGTFGLRARKAVLGFVNDTQQEIAFLHDPDRLTVRHDPRGGARRAARKGRRASTGRSASTSTSTRGRRGALVEAAAGAGRADGGRVRFRMIGVHTKSKAPHGARNPDAVMRLAIENRRKQLAQCVWLRRRVEEHLVAGDPLIVLGDFNDGPGLDEYERLFGRSGVEVVMGEAGAVQLHDPAARRAMQSRTAAAPTSARFWIAEEGRWMETLLDYIMVSPDLMGGRPAGASGTRSTIPAATACRNCARRCWPRRITSPSRSTSTSDLKPGSGWTILGA